MELRRLFYALILSGDFSFFLLFSSIFTSGELKELTTDGWRQPVANLKLMTIVIYEISWYLNSLRTLHNFLLLFFFRSFYHFDPINHHLNLNLTVQGPPLQQQSNLITLQSFHFIPTSLLFYLLRLKHDTYIKSLKKIVNLRSSHQQAGQIFRVPPLPAEPSSVHKQECSLFSREIPGNRAVVSLPSLSLSLDQH